MLILFFLFLPIRVSVFHRVRRTSEQFPNAADNDNRFPQGNWSGFLSALAFISEAAESYSLQKKKIIEAEIL